jgi:hypothetical protein
MKGMGSLADALQSAPVAQGEAAGQLPDGGGAGAGAGAKQKAATFWVGDWPDVSVSNNG